MSQPDTPVVTPSSPLDVLFRPRSVAVVGASFDVGSYTFRLRNNAAFNECPANVTATFNGATATSDVDIRVD